MVSLKGTQMVTCPKCRKEFAANGLYGHLKYKHQLEGEQLEEVHRKATEEHTGEAGQQLQNERDLLERVSNLHDQLLEVRRRHQEAEAADGSGIFTEDEPAKALQLLYKREEKRIMEQLKQLVHDPEEVFAEVPTAKVRREQQPAAAAASAERPWDDP